MDPGEGWPPISGVISPLSTNTTILTLFHTKEAEFQRHFLQTVVAEDPQETASLCFDVRDIVLNQIHSLQKDTTASGKFLSLWPLQAVVNSLFQHKCILSLLLEEPLICYKTKKQTVVLQAVEAISYSNPEALLRRPKALWNHLAVKGLTWNLVFNEDWR